MSKIGLLDIQLKLSLSYLGQNYLETHNQIHRFRSFQEMPHNKPHPKTGDWGLKAAVESFNSNRQISQRNGIMCAFPLSELKCHLSGTVLRGQNGTEVNVCESRCLQQQCK